MIEERRGILNHLLPSSSSPHLVSILRLTYKALMVSSTYLHYICQLFFSKMREIFHLHRTWFSEDLSMASEDCQRFCKLFKDHLRFVMTSKDCQRFLDDFQRYWRCRNIFWWLQNRANDFQRISYQSRALLVPKMFWWLFWCQKRWIFI